MARSWLGRWLSYQSLHPELGDANPALVESVHKHGGRVYVYTVNQAEDMRRLLTMGADGFFTDDPVLARQILPVTNL